MGPARCPVTVEVLVQVVLGDDEFLISSQDESELFS
jgi:hypothetical protein